MDVFGNCVSQRTPCSREEDCHRDGGAIDHDLINHIEIGDWTTNFRIDNGRQGIKNVLRSQSHGVNPMTPTALVRSGLALSGAGR